MDMYTSYVTALKIQDMINKIKNMTLNEEDKDVIDLINSVNDTPLFICFKEYKDLFYSNLYFLIEKEKYLAKKYNYKMNLYNKLDQDTISKLSDMFIESHGDEKNFDWDDFNNYGYKYVLDPDYTDFFDKQEFSNKQEYQLIDVNFETYHPDNRVNSNRDDYEFYYSEKDNFHFTRRDLNHYFTNRYIIKKSGDTHYYFCKP